MLSVYRHRNVPPTSGVVQPDPGKRVTPTPRDAGPAPRPGQREVRGLRGWLARRFDLDDQTRRVTHETVHLREPETSIPLRLRLPSRALSVIPRATKRPRDLNPGRHPPLPPRSASPRIAALISGGTGPGLSTGLQPPAIRRTPCLAPPTPYRTPPAAWQGTDDLPRSHLRYSGGHMNHHRAPSPAPDPHSPRAALQRPLGVRTALLRDPYLRLKNTSPAFTSLIRISRP